MKRLRFIVKIPLVVCFFYVNLGFSQEVKKSESKISGHLVDSLGEKIPFATVKLLLVKDSSFLKGTIADVEGRFEILHVPLGSYLVSFTTLSTLPLFSKQIKIDSAAQEVNLGKVKLKEKVQTLNEVTIKANKNLVELKGDKLIVHLEGSFLAPGNTVSEVLPSLPSVTLKNSKILLNGKSTLILIDGKGEYNSRGIQEIINTLPADQVESIEIVRNPSAKYDANVQGVINIKLKKNKNYSQVRGALQNQFFPSNNISGQGYGRISTGLTLNQSIGRLNTSTIIDMATRSTLEVLQEKFEYSVDQRVLNNSQHLEKETFVSYRSDIQYKFGRKTTQVLGFIVGGFYSPSHRGDQTGSILYKTPNSKDSTLLSSWQAKTFNSVYNNATLYYTGKFSSRNDQLEAVIDTYQRSTPTSQIFVNSSAENSLIKEQIASSRNNTINGYAFNLNFTKGFSNKVQLESGVKLTQLFNQTDILYQPTGTEITSQGLTSFKYHYSERILSAYSIMTKSFEKSDINVGLRAEKVDASGGSTAEFSLMYLKLYPSIHFNFTSGKSIENQLSVTRKIARRPQFNDLNQQTEYKGPLNSFVGNQKLMPQITNELNFSSTILSKYTFSVFYDLDENIRSVVPLIQQNEPFSFQVVNINTAHTIGVSVSAPVQLFDWWRMNGNLNGYNYRVNSGVYNLNTNSLAVDVNFSNDFKISKKAKIKIQSDYSSAYKMGFNFSKSVNATILSFNLDVLQNLGTLVLAINDIFGTSKVISGEDYFGQYTRTYYPISNQRTVSLRFTYMFKTGAQLRRINSKNRNFGELRMN